VTAPSKSAVLTFAGKSHPISEFTFRPSAEGMSVEHLEAAMGDIGESVARQLALLTPEECAQFSADLDDFWRDLQRCGPKRPGQWGWRARAKRHQRRLAANDRRVAEWQRRQRYFRPLNRAALRLLGIFAPIVSGRATAAVL
jgi:hypothetical protein